MIPDSDRELSRLYRSAAREEPPSWLDDRVLAAARSEIVPGRKPENRFNLLRWQLPLALAAVVTLAVSLTLVVEGELEGPGSDAPVAAPTMQLPGTADSAARHGSSADASEARESIVHQPARSASPPTQSIPPAAEPAQRAGSLQSAPVPPDATPNLRARAEKAESQERQAFSEGRSNEVAAASPAPPSFAQSPKRSADAAVTPPLPASPGPQPAEAAASGRESERSAPASKPTESEPHQVDERRLAKRERSQGDTIARQAPAAAGAAPQRSDASKVAAQDQPALEQKQREFADESKSPEQWLREIEQLRREGRHEEARVQLEHFRKRFPNHSLPPALK